MSKAIWKPSTLLGPIPPVMVSCGDMNESNIITIAWCGIVNTNPPMCYISVRKSRFSYDIIKNSGEFAINLTNTELVRAADWCGVKSGRDVDKFAQMHLEKEKASQLSCPIIKQSPLSLECKVKQIIELPSHDMFLSEIVAIDVQPDIIDKNQKLCLEKASLVAFSHGEYFSLNDVIGTFGYSVKKNVKAKKKHKFKNKK
ncbi:MAG: flavin reductase family protein [Oscillospiraceae bacterium]